ncbi:hypothetical protein IV203_027208 [Nitzschia inconspicua]|uniref:Uncharacterized protein n=1 Tax=Nitzschia inconspicua TaxID=303405 RepID=A0A9K3Q342_9STRA|nr:hypothetical protein IV203_027208 [Nitzschia inconspicua]
MNFFPDPAEIVVDGGPIPAAAAAAAATIAPDGGGGGAAVGGHLTLNNVRDGVVSGRSNKSYLPRRHYRIFELVLHPSGRLADRARQ